MKETPASNPKPAVNYDHKIQVSGGHPIEVHAQSGTASKVAGAWLTLGGRDKSLSVQSVQQGSTVQEYIGYRDGTTNLETFALSIEADGSETVQVVLPPELCDSFDKAESARVRIMPLYELCRLIAANPYTSPPA